MKCQTAALVLIQLIALTFAAELGPAGPDASDVDPANVPPSCDSDIYCKGELLHTVQMSEIFVDSKSFVDMKVRDSPEEALKSFQKMMEETRNKPTFEQVRAFVNATFEDGDELEEWEPEDWTETPSLVSRIDNDLYRDWAIKLNELWKTLGRKMKSDIHDRPEHYSLLYVPHGFIIPGGRFKELYYWDSYWIVQGLLHSDMAQTAKGVIENLLYLVQKLGFVPNGSRVYYKERSQPPLLTAMARAYYEKTKDLQFVRDNFNWLEQEFEFWMNNSMVEVEKDGKKYKLSRYFFLSNGPRPESYREDYNTTKHLSNRTEDRERMYWEIKSGAATGWDFSSRWFIKNGTNEGNMSDIRTTMIVPADLNAFLYGAAKGLQSFATLLEQRHKAGHYGRIAADLLEAVQAVLWNETDGIWYDYDALNKIQRKYFYGSNMAPLWTLCYDREKSAEIGRKVVGYIVNKTNILSYRGGTPSSLNQTGEQWDFPNCWAPLQAFIIQGLDQTGEPEAQNLAEELARRWLHANYVGYTRDQTMFEKYSAVNIGARGGGGEYGVQEGFGWTNGLIFELLAKYSCKCDPGSRPFGAIAGVLEGLEGLGQNFWSNTLERLKRVEEALAQDTQAYSNQQGHAPQGPQGPQGPHGGNDSSN